MLENGSGCRLKVLIVAAALLCLASVQLAAQPALNVEAVANVDAYGQYNEVWGYSAPNGVELAILGTIEGTAFYLTNDPVQPELVGFVAGPPSVWRDMKTYREFCYVVTEGEGAPLQIIDLSEPRQPQLVSTLTAGFSTAHNIFIDEPAARAYVCGTDQGMVVLDLADPLAPRRIGSYTDHYVHDVYVRDNVAYAASIYEGLLILLDMTDPRIPEELASVRYPGAATHNTWLSDDARILVTTDEVSGGHLRVWDVSNLTRPQVIGSYAASGSVHNALVRGELCYMAYYAAGLRIVSLENPADPREIGAYDTYPAAGLFDGLWGVYPFHRDPSILYGSDISTGLYVFRFADPTAGVVITHTPLADTPDPLRPHLVEVAIDAAAAIDPGSVQLLYQVDQGAENMLPMHATDDADTYEATIPEQPYGAVVRYYVEATDAAGTVGTSPRNAPAHRHSFVIGTLPVVETFDMESEAGWSVDPGTATSGHWELAEPVGNGRFEGSEFVIVVPDEDHTRDPGAMAWVTENEREGELLGAHDVDGGETRLVSPLIDLSGQFFARLGYWLWFERVGDGSATDDVFAVDVSSDGGATWCRIDAVVEGTAGRWVSREVDLTNGIELTGQVRVRFVARDEGGSTLVEAAVDDVTIRVAPVGEAGVTQAPNPIATNGTIRFRLAETGAVRLRIFDVQGRAIRTLLDDVIGAGEQVIEWDGRTYQGVRVASGVYFYRLEIGDSAQTAKIIVQR